MKMKGITTSSLVLILLAGLLVFQACEKEKVYPRTRLFQPVLNEDLYSVDNTIIVNLGKMKEAESYLLEVSRDSFQTTLYSVEIDTNYVVIDKDLVGEELLWFTIYQVRVTAYADDPEYNSLPSFLGSVRTQKYPSNMGTPGPFDVTDTRARVFWTPSGNPISKIKVYAGEDERLLNPLMEIGLTLEDIEASMKIISGLEPSTKYQIAIFSFSVLRGWELYETKEALISGPNVVDLTIIDSTEINLAYRLPDVEDGNIVLLAGGTTYLANGYSFDKSVEFRSGYSFVPALPVIDCDFNFNLVAGSNVGHIIFKDIHIMGSGDGYNTTYVFNTSVSATLGELRFESCTIRGLRGIFRMKDAGPGTVDKYTISDCVIDSIRDYGILTVDMENWQVNEILIENSTISKAITFLTSKNNSSSIIIDGCTVNETPETGRQIFRWRDLVNNNVINGINITNTIWGHPWVTAEPKPDPPYLVDGYDGMGTTNWTVINTYATGDFGFDPTKEAIPGFPSATYSGTAAELWTDPYNAIFNFLDNGFSGKGDSGDPRWRMGL